jgi:hypothetical protein
MDDDVVLVTVLTWVICWVTVDPATVDVVVEPVPVPVLPESPEILNGNEYWKMAGFESREMSKPKVAESVRVVGIFHANEPLALSIAAAQRSG